MGYFTMDFFNSSFGKLPPNHGGFNLSHWVGKPFGNVVESWGTQSAANGNYKA
jgi:hypothetical protein